MKPTNETSVTDSPEDIARGSLQQHGSAAVVAEIRCEGRTIEELADRIARIAGAVRNGSDKFNMNSKHSRCEVKPITQPLNNALSKSHENEPQKKLS